jgi:hypothetical protein
MRQKRICFLLENPQQKGHLQDSGIDGRKINMDVMGKDNKEWSGFRRLI